MHMHVCIWHIIKLTLNQHRDILKINMDDYLMYTNDFFSRKKVNVFHLLQISSGTSLVVQQLRLCGYATGGVGSIPGWGRYHMPHGAAKNK